MTPPAAARAADPAIDLRLAQLHLRMGQLGLARAELEALAGSGDLDDGGLLALAEARWRTGDLVGAGEAAQAYLETGGGDLVALVIAAEAVAAAGRPGEARRIAGRALEQAGAPLDGVFAGMPRSPIWPVDPAAGAEPAPTLFGAERATRRAALPRSGASPSPVAGSPDTPGLWDTGVAPAGLPDAAELLDAARDAVAAGRVGDAAVAFALVLRTGPELAPAVLEATDDASEDHPVLALVRGDAFRLVGHELEARHAWAAAAAGLGAAPAAGLDRGAAAALADEDATPLAAGPPPPDTPSLDPRSQEEP